MHQTKVGFRVCHDATFHTPLEFSLLDYNYTKNSHSSSIEKRKRRLGKGVKREVTPEFMNMSKEILYPQIQGVTNLSPLKESCPEIQGWSAKSSRYLTFRSSSRSQVADVEAKLTVAEGTAGLRRRRGNELGTAAV